MKIVVLTSETPANIWLVNEILSTNDVTGIVIERRPLALSAAEKANRRLRMIERYGWLRTANKLAFNRVKSWFLAPAESREVCESCFPASAPITYSRRVPTIVVESINEPACVQFIQERGAEILAVCGTTVLKPEVFTAAPRGAINIHTGITPEYRCADPILWALYYRQPEKVGVTIHYIDEGIDTGAIIHQQSVPVYADDSLASIYIRCIRHGAELYLRSLREIGDGTARTLTREGVRSQAFLSIDLGLVQYLLFRWRFYCMSSRLPRERGLNCSVSVENSR